jgi:hypothetical protein
MSSFRAAMMAIRASFTFLGIFATLLLTPAGAEEKPGRPSQPSLIVTPAGSMAFSGPHGGPFSPARLEFRVSSTTGIVNYSIRTPSWLTTSSTFGTPDTRGVTITTAEASCWTTAEDTCWTTTLAVCWHSNSDSAGTLAALVGSGARKASSPVSRVAPRAGAFRPKSSVGSEPMRTFASPEARPRPLGCETRVPGHAAAV